MPDPFLTIGFAHRDDFYGAWATIQSIRSAHRDILRECEFVIVDNSPNGSQHAEKLKGLCDNIRNLPSPVKYVRMPDIYGTTYTRREVFNQASGRFVLVMDCHVVFPTDCGKVGLKPLLDFLKANPDSNDIYSGPLMYDSMTSGADHFDPNWGAEMLGQWGVTWVHPDGRSFVCRRTPSGLGFFDAKTREKIELNIPSHAWEGHERHLAVSGCKPAISAQEPFEIPGMGLGMFCMRKDALPALPEGLKGFGGEELHIHELVRMNGGRAMCLPFVPWVHRFGYVGGTPYPNIIEEKYENNLRWEVAVGMDKKKLWGLDISDCIEHFRGKIPDSSHEAICKKVLGGDHMACGCNKKAEVAAVPEPETIEALFQKNKAESSDINEHLDDLMALASQCKTVVEFGVRTGVSTSALVAGCHGFTYSYDVNDSAGARAIENMAPERFKFTVANSLEVDIPECDLLFIDTQHTGAQVLQELEKHHAKVSRWIAMHDTETFGETGDVTAVDPADGKTKPVPGLLHGIRKFLKDHPNWTVMSVKRNNNGLMVLTCDDRDRPALPGKAQQVFNFAKAMIRTAASGFQQASMETVEKRLDLCVTCPLRAADNRCSKCGCYLVQRPDGGPGKALLATEMCPIGKWHAE